MTPQLERSAGVIPFRWETEPPLEDGLPVAYPLYLILHSATVRNPRARWEFPKGGIEPGETPRQAAGREFVEETGITQWNFRDPFERILSYTYIRRGRKVVKTVTYYLVEILDPAALVRSEEHAPDPDGDWHRWGRFDEIAPFLYHAKIRNLFAEAHQWLQAQKNDR